MHPSLRQSLLPVGVALSAILAAALCAAFFMPFGPSMFLAMAGAAAAAYMAINIGANDVANNMGPSVGARALKMGTALAIAAVLEVAGALLAGRGVIKTVSQDLLSLDPALPGQTLIFVMIAATLAGALWINASTFVGTPVSTTHAIVGGVVGAGIAAAGMNAIDWRSVGIIAVSWTLSPVLGGVIAAGLHAFIRRRITRRRDKIAAARRWVPLLIAAMAATFAVYLQMVFDPSPTNWPAMAMLSSGFGVLAFLIAKPWVRRESRGIENRKKQVARLFRPPLIGAAALLSFAHGANDLANAVAPLAAILAALEGGATRPLTAPLWIMLIGAFGIALGILLFGPRVIRTIGEQITKLNEIRAFCVALSAAITVLAASALALPISSTHVAVGAVFGVGFLREYLAMRNMHGAAVPVQTYAVDASTLNDTPQQALQRERRGDRRFLVRRLKVVRIGAAWVITLPAAALLAALFYALLYRLVGFSAA